MVFNGGLSPLLDVFSERFSVTLSRNGALRTHYFYTVGYETTQPEYIRSSDANQGSPSHSNRETKSSRD